MQEGASEGTVVTLGDISSANVQGRDPNGGAFMGDNGPHMESEGGVLGYWTRVSDMEGMRISDEISVEASFPLAPLPAWIHR